MLKSMMAEEATTMMKLMIKHTSQELREIFNNGTNSCISLETPEGYELLGGTFAQRSWLAGDKSQGMTIEKRQKITNDELKEIEEVGEGHIFIFEDTLYLLSLHEKLNNIKYPIELLETFEKAGIEITDLR